jgi:hypothetical protein
MTNNNNCCIDRKGKRLSTYYSESEALDSAKYEKNEHGLDFVPYRCKKCEYWHLSPRERQTPSKECEFCTDSGGKRKQLYENREAAVKRAEIIKRESKISLTVYKCPYRSGWHLKKG